MKIYLLACAGMLFVSAMNQQDIDVQKPTSSEESVSLAEDTYKVIRVDGRIVFVRTGKDMSRGDEFRNTEKLDFKTQQSRAAVISRQQGRKILAPSSSGRSSLLPAMNNIASRSGGLINAIDLKNHFSGKYLVIDHNKLVISSSSYPMNDEQFFFFRYEYGGETISKKPEFSKDTLFVDPQELYMIDGAPIDGSGITEIQVYYREGKTNTLIGSFEPVFPEEEDIIAETEIILEQTETEDKEERINEVMAYLNEFYGKPNKEDLVRWMEAHMKL